MMMVPFAFACLLGLTVESFAPGDATRSVQVDGALRTYLVHVPPQYDPVRPTPVVLVFHGVGANAASMTAFCGMSKKADEAGFLVAYPNGLGLGGLFASFNAGFVKGLDGPCFPDDVAFTRAILGDLAAIANVDPKRVYATGMSNGGMMCYRLAAELSDRIAAIAAVGGTLGLDKCSPSRAVPVLHFHGTADTIMPYDGLGKKISSFLSVKSVEFTVQTWAQLNDCPTEPVTFEMPDTTDDGMTVERRTYGPGLDGSEVVLYRIRGGGHTWPGRQPPLKFLGKSTTDIDANDLIWEFFERHPLK